MYDVGDLELLSRISHRKRRFAGHLGDCLFDIGWYAIRFRHHFELPIEEMLAVARRGRVLLCER